MFWILILIDRIKVSELSLSIPYISVDLIKPIFILSVKRLSFCSIFSYKIGLYVIGAVLALLGWDKVGGRRNKKG